MIGGAMPFLNYKRNTGYRSYIKTGLCINRHNKCDSVICTKRMKITYMRFSLIWEDQQQPFEQEPQVLVKVGVNMSLDPA